MSLSETWFETRQRLSHDVLRNRVLNAFDNTQQGVENSKNIEPYIYMFLSQEKEFRAFLDTSLTALRPGDWLAEWMSPVLDFAEAETLRQFINKIFIETSSLPGKIDEINLLLDRTVSAARQTLMSHGSDKIRSLREAELRLSQLANELANLPSSMTGVVETMR